jgi:regulator of sigma E protease
MIITLFTIIFVVLLFTVLVVGHEFGHFIMAKRNGVDVEEFGVGFPPRVGKGRLMNGTLYTLNWLPLGGFVRMAGEDGNDAKPGTFSASTLWVKTKILLAGVIMNLILAIVILYVLCLTGLPGLGAQFEPSFLKPSYAQPKQLLLTNIEPGSPAQAAGLVRNDTLLLIGGVKLESDSQLRDYTNAHHGEKTTITYVHENVQKTSSVQLRQPNSKGILGVNSQQVYKLKYGVFQSLVAAIWITGTLFVATIVAVVSLILNIPVLILGLFSAKIPAAAEAASGPIGIVYILTNISHLGMSYIFLFMANISVALAGFNVLPLPALDGGRLAVAVVRRLSGGRITTDSEATYHGIGFIALLGLVTLISVYDVRKYFLHG